MRCRRVGRRRYSRRWRLRRQMRCHWHCKRLALGRGGGWDDGLDSICGNAGGGRGISSLSDVARIASSGASANTSAEAEFTTTASAAPIIRAFFRHKKQSNGGSLSCFAVKSTFMPASTRGLLVDVMNEVVETTEWVSSSEPASVSAPASSRLGCCTVAYRLSFISARCEVGNPSPPAAGTAAGA